METIDHRALKGLALAWLWGAGCRAVALEVTGPIPRWRFDAAGWRHTRLESEAIVIECKQSRSDFLRDNESSGDLVAERVRLQARRAHIEETRVKVYEHHLRRGEPQLFEERASWDFAQSRLADYRRVLVRLKQLDHAIHGETKFCMISRYRLADRCYLLAPHGMIRPREVPEGWGLLECPRHAARRSCRSGFTSGVPIREIRSALPLRARADRRERLLRNIATAASRAAFGRFAAQGELNADSVKRVAREPRNCGSLFDLPSAAI